jgi:hypothetical protein
MRALFAVADGKRINFMEGRYMQRFSRLRLPVTDRRATRGVVMLAASGFALALAGYGFSGNANAAVIFSDNLTTSTVNASSPAAPTSSSTNYDVLSSKNATNSAINHGTGDLTLTLNAATTSGFVEIEALFSTDPTPFALANTGDTIEYDVTFKDTASLLAGGTGSGIFFGLYNSEGGSYPDSGLNNSGLSTATGSAYATGGTVNWQGYVGDFIMTGGSNKVNTRPQQTGAGTTSANQDLVGNNFGGGAYDNPAGTQIGSTEASTISLTTGGTYTADMLITLLPSGQLSIQDTLYNGAGTGGTTVQSQSVTTTVATDLVSSFDGLAFGQRNSGTSYDPTADITAISVDYTPAVTPEPATLGLFGLMGLGLMHRRHRWKV